jgi:magnesium-transporting ATPase (P-type)
MSIFDAFYHHHVKTINYALAIIISHLAVWGFSAIVVASTVTTEAKDKDFICFHPLTQNTDMINSLSMSLPFLLLCVCVIISSRQIGKLRKAALEANLKALETNSNEDDTQDNVASTSIPNNELRSPLLDVVSSNIDNGPLVRCDTQGFSPSAHITEEQGVFQATVTRFILTIFTMVCILSLLMALLLDWTMPDSSTTIFELRFLSETLCTSVGLIVSLVMAFHKRFVIQPMTRFFGRLCCTNTCCGGIASDPQAHDPLWSTFSPKNSQGHTENNQ